MHHYHACMIIGDRIHGHCYIAYHCLTEWFCFLLSLTPAIVLLTIIAKMMVVELLSVFGRK